jgi:hypothetical protein
VFVVQFIVRTEGSNHMAICPFADTRWLIRPGANDPRITARIAILHSDGGNAENLGPYFDGPSGGIESHFHISKSGHLYQYRDTDWEADANYRANPFGISIETQGTGYEEWTEAQIVKIVRLLKWLNTTHQIPLRLCDTWDGAGVGWHIQFGSPGPWTPSSKICPGPKRITQIGTTIIPALKGDWFVMATEEDLRRIIRQEVGNARIVTDVKGKGDADDVSQSLSVVLRRLLDDEKHVKDVVRRQAASIKSAIIEEVRKVETSGGTGSVSEAQVEAAVEKGLRDVLGGLDA